MIIRKAQVLYLTLRNRIVSQSYDNYFQELMFHLPISSDSQLLEEFFRLFDERLSEWNLTEYGISAPTLQDVSTTHFGVR